MTPVRVSDTKFGITYYDNLTGYGTLIIGTISGTVITMGTKLVWASTSTTPLGIGLLDTDKLIIFYTEGVAAAKAVIATLTGTSISYGVIATIYTGNVTLSLNATQAKHAQLAVVSSTVAAVTYLYKATNGFVETMILSVSGTTITPETAGKHTIDLGGTSVSYTCPCIVSVSATRLAILYHNQNSGGSNPITALSITGTAVGTVGSTTISTITQSGYNIQLVYLGSNRFAISHYTSPYYYLIIAVLTGTTFGILEYSGGEHILGDFSYVSGNKLLAGYVNNSMPIAKFIDIQNSPVVTPVRFLLATAAAGEQIEISSLFAKCGPNSFSASNKLRLYKNSAELDSCFYSGGYSDLFSPTAAAETIPMTLANCPIILKENESLYASYSGSSNHLAIKGIIIINGIKRSA
jgi:hypothetical protein